VGSLLRRVVAAAPEGLRLSPHQWKTVRAVAACRTGALGGQLYVCGACHREHFVAHSCRNRHCPQCQGKLASEWLEEQEAALLPIPYFHLVFTVPHLLNGLIRQNRRVVYKVLFDAVSATLLEFGERRLKARIGMTAVLHTWSQSLLDHYHLHCIVTGGGVALAGQKWVHAAAHYLFPVKALGAMFRGKFLHELKERFEQEKLEFHGEIAHLAGRWRFGRLLRLAGSSKWVVYAKRPFAGPRQVLGYLSRYTHRVAISNGRLKSADERSVSFDYKDYADGAKHKTMTLTVVEFVRRFCLHILPPHFVKIRHYGLLSNRNREERLAEAGTLLKVAIMPEQANPAIEKKDSHESPVTRCPFCGETALIRLCEVDFHSTTKIPIIDSS
jgi:hypothetical protein